MRITGKYKDIPPVVSSTGGFYNPDPQYNQGGEFYLDVNGIPKMIKIVYRGRVEIERNPNFPDTILFKNNRTQRTITIISFDQVEYPEEKIFTFSGTFDNVIHVKIYGWSSLPIFSAFTNYDQTNTPLGESRTNLEDDDIIIRDLKTTKKYNTGIVKRNNEDIDKLLQEKNKDNTAKLPRDYIKHRNILKSTSKQKPKNQYCVNCKFITGNNHCEKWHAKIERASWCASWKKKEGVR